MADDPWAAFRISPDDAPAAPAAAPAAPAAPDTTPSPPISQPDIWASYRNRPTVDPVDAIPGTRGPDKYRQAAIDERDKFIAAGASPPLEGYGAKAAYGAGMGWGDELMAGALTPLEMIKRGIADPREAYKYTKAAQDLSTENQPQGFLGGAASLSGGLATGAGVFGGPRAATIPFTSRALPEAVAPAYNYGRNVLKGSALGAAVGAGEGNNFDERLSGAKMGGVLGGGVAAALPIVAPVAGFGARIMQAPRLRPAENMAVDQVSKAAADSGQTLDQILQKMRDAHAAGQTDYTLADAIGKEGERKLAAQGKIPGPARERITEVLGTRDLNMPQRVSGEVGRALGAPGTAEQATTSLIDQASTQSSPLYKAAEEVPTWSSKLDDFLKQPEAQAGLKHGVTIQRLESVGTGKPFNPTDAAITSFNEAGDPIISGVPNMRTLQTVKIGLDKMIEDNTDKITGKTNAYGRALTGFKNRMLDEMTTTNPLYGEANAAFAGPMRVKEAVEQGREMASRGRFEDTVPAFQSLPPAEQQGVRIGYADAVRAPLEKTGNYPTILREKSMKGSNELANLSLYQGPQMPGRPDQMRQFLNREEEMQRTSKAALGGSSTAENLADITSAPGGGEAVGMITSAAGHSPGGFIKNATEFLLRASKGESEKQRDAIAKMLLTREPDATANVINQLADYNLRRRGVNPWTGQYRFPEGQ
jgi:hypothetical protein